jgi:DNA polymerase-1
LQVTKITFESLVGSGAGKKRIDEVPLCDVAAYACEDADCVWRLVPILEKELTERNLMELFCSIEMPLVTVLARMERNGVCLDVEMLKNLSESAEKQIHGISQQIYAEAGEEFNLNSPKQLAVILFEKLKLPAVKKTKTGYSTDVGVLEELSTRHVLPRLVLEYREYAKLKSTYLDALPALIDANTGVVHASFNQTVTATGRLSSSEPNLQNIPIRTDMGRLVRKAFIPRASDRCIISADYSQIELRLLAHFSEDEALCDAFRDNRDIHTYTATLLYNVPESAVTSQMRHFAKTVNFSIIYGKTAFGFSRDAGIPLAEAQAFITAYFNRYPRIKLYLDSLKEEAHTQGYVTTLFGRRVYVPDIVNRNQMMRQFAERAAMNAPLQGSAADLIKRAMISADEELRTHKVDALLIIQVHDELVYDVALSCAA